MEGAESSVEPGTNIVVCVNVVLYIGLHVCASLNHCLNGFVCFLFLSTTLIVALEEL